MPMGADTLGLPESLGTRMRRREFIGALGGAAAWPLAVCAQPARKVPIIGFLGQSTPTAESQRLAAFLNRLRELGWIEGQTVAIDIAWGEGKRERFAEIANRFVRLNVDVIVTSGTASVVAAKEATTTIPIVFAVAGDPVANRLVASLARPAGNITGLSTVATDLAGKRVELIREAVPGFQRLAILGNAGSPLAVLETGEVEAAARNAGIRSVALGIRRAEDIAGAFEALRGPADALYVVADPLTNTNRAHIHTLAMSAKVPAIYNAKEHVEAGGLIAYGPNFAELYRRAATFVDRILRGGKPGDIPVEQPTKFDLVINLTSAKALGITVSPTLLARADEVIE
jgi:putative tryptophan/tyrosine transport system substrate-binding protein